jgi:hypothetical protein
VEGIGKGKQEESSHRRNIVRQTRLIGCIYGCVFFFGERIELKGKRTVADTNVVAIFRFKEADASCHLHRS